ncbi:helix-turn-helix domain-containing protein [Leucobacter allii]|uniref:helix-turn-helix domain-containing protein n=1 Tax=Leucobacter allii TaxID=2932247 RepID=UPI001FD25F81|nr:helix-turn-helix domain-containing protein [Leucobacter allii]UOR02449.1 helix-turn-helix domain-containing protein [Leucobacter allii]
MNELLSVDDVAARLQLQPRTVREYIRVGRLRATRIGKQYRIHIEDLKLMERGATAPSVDPGDLAAVRTTASVVVRVDAASTEQEQRVSSLLNVSGAAPGVALQVVSLPQDHALQVIASGPLDAVLTVLTIINNALEITRD